jgi:hypothetical protein
VARDLIAGSRRATELLVWLYSLFPKRKGERVLNIRGVAYLEEAGPHVAPALRVQTFVLVCTSIGVPLTRGQQGGRSQKDLWRPL